MILKAELPLIQRVVSLLVKMRNMLLLRLDQIPTLKVAMKLRQTLAAM